MSTHPSYRPLGRYPGGSSGRKLLLNPAYATAYASVHIRIDEARRTMSTAPVVDSRGLRAALRLWRQLTDGDGDILGRLELGWFHWIRYIAHEGDKDIERALTLLTYCLKAGVEFDDLPPEMLPSLVNRVDPQAEDVRLRQRLIVALDSGHPGLAGAYANLGSALRNRFKSSESADDLDQAIAWFRRALQIDELDETDDEDSAIMLYNLGESLTTRYERGGPAADLDEAIACFRDMPGAPVAEGPSPRERQGLLGGALHSRFLLAGHPEDLEESIRALEGALAASTTDAERANSLSHLGTALRDGFLRGPLPPADLDKAITLLSRAVDLTPEGVPGRPYYLSNLGNGLRTRAEAAGTADDADEAVDRLREALSTTPATDRTRGAVLNNLAQALQVRYRKSAALVDLDEAITLLEESAELDRGPLGEGVLSNLGTALRNRFQRTEVMADLDRAIEVGRRAVADGSSRHPDRAGFLANLGVALKVRFDRTGQPADLDEAIDVGRQGVENTPSGHLERAGRISNLGLAFQSRFEAYGSREDLDEAVSWHRRAVAAIASEEDPQYAVMAHNLGLALWERAELIDSTSDLEEAVTRFEQAASTELATPLVRIRSAQVGGGLAAATQPARGARLLELAVRLLPEVAPRALGRSDQQDALDRHPGLAHDAAALVLSDPTKPPGERAALALRLLESGRALLYGQALETRTDLTDLSEAHPDLASRFRELRELLDRPSGPLGDPGGPRQSVADRRQVARRWTDLLTEIRARPGFASFALPPPTAELTSQAEHGPVVVFNTSEHRSDALILTRDGIDSVPLPNLGTEALVAQIEIFLEALRTTGEDTTLAQHNAAQERLRAVLAWLWDSATGPVLDALGIDAPPATDMAAHDWPRIWWVPGRHLSLLPLHAAGHHTDPPDAGARTVMDRVISSYTPTIGALRHARGGTAQSGPVRALIVAMPTTPGTPGNLPYVPAEAALAAACFPDSTTLTEPDPATPDSTTLTEPDPTVPGPADRRPTRANVLALLPTHPVAHFACHGISDPADPSNSRLLLSDHRTEPLTVSALGAIRLDRARLAYLSACETALAYNLLDESIHLTSAFQLAGYPHVIGTLWPIYDQEALDVATTFYTTLTGTGDQPDFRHAAHALHRATQDMRRRFPLAPSHWAAHLHTGA
ncbi:CHAT domain-containing protein [Nonomuraea jiangxiensis]|uniref:CHAT domain-containing protein n=1 Tax=Nonomuraea jiangxiensis TaxID=633440 RepID=A0A1G9SRY9_9ACTN|nr:CHAT domain-containing tetratricopeptide repeat protein [Nonomuraea jiangxiensis]SDM38170.1 CHAT domain-containing protein [Nonomuraea jiangxiensis]